MKSLIAAALLGTIAGSAAAQSSATVFGILDVAARHVKNGSVGSINSMVSGGTATSRWGIRGMEDLGGGLRAGFWLEGDIGVDTGLANATFWNRRTTVSLISAQAGELRLGRDLVPTHVASCSLDPFGCVGMLAATTYRATQAAVFSGIGNVQLAFRANNSIAYLTPANLGGFSAHGMVSLGENQISAGTEQSKGQGLRLGYSSGPVSVQAGAWQVKNTTAAVADFKDLVFGASYDFGVVKAAVQRRSFKFSTEKLDVTMFHLSAPVGSGVAKLTYMKANQISPNAAINARDSSTIGAGYQYYLSKRTSVYGNLGQVSNKGTATFTVAGGPAVTAANFGGQKSTAYEVGLRHDF